MVTSTLEEYPNKRNKSTREDDESDAVMEDSFERGMETHPRPRTPSPTSPTLSPESTIKIVRQTSVVPGLQDTENAVWDAAQRDAIFTSLSGARACSGSVKQVQAIIENRNRDEGEDVDYRKLSGHDSKVRQMEQQVRSKFHALPLIGLDDLLTMIVSFFLS